MEKYRPGLGDHPGRVIRMEGGFIEFRLGPAKTCEIVNIEVERASRRKGIASKMLYDLLHGYTITQVYAFTRSHNSIAIAWYKKNGFHLTRIPDFYGYALDAYLCVKNRPF